jgi:hypothetical protein
MTTQDLLCYLKGDPDKELYTLIHITDIGTCYIARLKGKKDGEIKKVEFYQVEPVGFNPLTVKNLEDIPEKESYEPPHRDWKKYVLMIGTDVEDATTVGLYKDMDLPEALAAYEKVYEQKGALLAYLDKDRIFNYDPALDPDEVKAIFQKQLDLLESALKDPGGHEDN